MLGESFAPLVVPAWVWDQPEMVCALSDRDIATVLMLVQTHVPQVSQHRLATELGMPQPSINQIVNRRRHVTSLESFERVADGLKMPDRARKVLGLAPQARPADAMAIIDGQQGLSGDSREQLSRAGARLTEEVTVMNAAESESARFTQRAETTNVGPNTLEQLYADVRRIVTCYPSRPVAPLFVETFELRNWVFDLLDGRQRPEQTRELYVIAAVLSGVLANAAFDLGSFAAADTHARAAFVAADHAGHTGMRAWLRGTQALIAYWDNRPHDAATAAADGWRYAPESGTARVRAACIEARARARMRDRQGADDALRRAEIARDAITNPDEFGGMMGFPVAKQSLYGGAAQLWLGDRKTSLTDAKRMSTEAIDLYMQDPPGQRRIGEMSLARLDLAQATLIEGDLDTAAAHIDQVLDDGGSRRTEAVSRRLLELAPALNAPKYRTTALAGQLRERITSAPLHTPPALPAGGDQ